jgi:hypothetical protein
MLASSHKAELFSRARIQVAAVISCALTVLPSSLEEMISRSRTTCATGAAPVSRCSKEHERVSNSRFSQSSEREAPIDGVAEAGRHQALFWTLPRGVGPPRCCRDQQLYVIAATDSGLDGRSSDPGILHFRSGDQAYRRVVAAIDFSPQAEAVVTASRVLLPHARLPLVRVADIPLRFQQAPDGDRYERRE